MIIILQSYYFYIWGGKKDEKKDDRNFCNDAVDYSCVTSSRFKR